MRVERPTYKACGATQIILCTDLPNQLTLLVPEVEALIERLPTLSMRELSGDLLELLDALRALRDLEFHVSESWKKDYRERQARRRTQYPHMVRDDESSRPAPTVPTIESITGQGTTADCFRATVRFRVPAPWDEDFVERLERWIRCEFPEPDP